jgi:hypothetical protein
VKVLAHPLPEEPYTITELPYTPPKQIVFDDFKLFTPKKRKENDAPEEHSAKKGKTEDKNEDYIMMDQK